MYHLSMSLTTMFKLLLIQNAISKALTSLGEVFNIQTIELDGAISGGKSLFTDLDSSCFHSEELKEATKNYKVYTDHEEFVHEIALSVGLTAKELGGKGDISTKYLKGGHKSRS